jgi:hypothetical protein
MKYTLKRVYIPRPSSIRLRSILYCLPPVHPLVSSVDPILMDVKAVYSVSFKMSSPVLNAYMYTHNRLEHVPTSEQYTNIELFFQKLIGPFH